MIEIANVQHPKINRVVLVFREESMGDFFKGWRRRSGCLFLVIAILFQSAWFRSRSVTDDFSVHVDGSAAMSVDFDLSSIVVMYMWKNAGSVDFVMGPRHVDWSTRPVQGSENGNETVIVPEIDRVEWIQPPARGRGFLVKIPYLTSVTFFTMLSATLILWPRRRQKQMAVSV